MRARILPRAIARIFCAGLPLLLAACAGNTDTGAPIGASWFSSTSPIWSTVTGAKDAGLDREQTVNPEDYVDAGGHCAAYDTQVAVAAAPAEQQVDAAAAAPAPPPVLGGIALGMTECQVVQRAGIAANVAIGDAGADRKVVLTYNSGNWPGIYTFVAGRLKEVQRGAVVEQPKKPVKKKKPAKPKPA